MLVDFNPYIFQIKIFSFPIQATWYGLMYVLGFFSFYLLSQRRAKLYRWTEQEISDFLTYGMLGVVLGGRIGHCIFPYGWSQWAQDWTYIFKIWQGGMSFHGGLLGVLFACYLFARKTKRKFFQVTDFIAMSVPIGLFFGRIGNFINGELWGSPSDVPWAMIFPSGGMVARHPTQLYEALLEGLLTFVILWIYGRKLRPTGKISALFLLCYGFSRCLVELWRVPDSHLGYYFNFLTMGQILSIPMLIFGAILYYKSGDKNEKLS